MAPGCKRARLRPRTKGKFKGGLGWVLLWRAFFPSPLVGEGGALWSALALLSAPDEGSLSAETDPSPVRDASHRGHPLPQGERERKNRPHQPRFGQAAATASAIQLTISSVPPVGAAIGNRPWPANCRMVRSPANSALAITKPHAAD